MDVRRFEIEGPVELVPKRFTDERGYFCETFNAESLANAGISEPQWVQDNQSYSKNAHTLRGLHFQLQPLGQAKLVRVLKGSIFDVAVDIRRSSPTHSEWIAVTLSASHFNQLYIPAGFAHGFLTLEPNVEVLYKVSAMYSKNHDRSIAWNDPDINVGWPLETGKIPLLSEKDARAPTLAELMQQSMPQEMGN
jgi:dTDP-4-dehydrorhamnose 3,5-epimerase